jgi:predicted dehydrogenase
VAAPVRLGVVGIGALGLRVLAHLALPDVHDAVRVTHVCDPAEGRAEAAARRFGVGRWSRSLGRLLEDPEVDTVTIASPIALHHEQGLTAIRAGKHVHCNKTMALTAEQATELIEAARAADLRLVASPGEMLRPHNQRVKAMIADGVIGTPCWAACGAAFGAYHVEEPERQGSGPLENIDPSWYFRSPGGGPLFDMTVYALHGLTGILGTVERVTALSGTRIHEREIGGRRITTEAHDNTLMLLDFGDGLFALAYGTAAGILTEGTDWDPSGSYYGTRGRITGLLLDGAPFDYPGRELVAGPSAEPRREPGDRAGWLLPHVTEAHRGLPEQHVFEDVMQLVDWVRDGTPSVATPEHARHVIDIIDAAYRAASSGTTQRLTTTVDGMAPV